MNELIWVDTETTGLDPELHEIIEIGWLVTDLRGEPTGQKGSARVKFSGYCTPGAQAVNGYDPSDWIDAEPLDSALADLLTVLEGRRYAGQNPAFDQGFLRRGCRRCELEWPCNHHPVVLASVCWPLVADRDPVPQSLYALCLALGVEPEPKPHTALGGARNAAAVYRVAIGG